MKLFLKAMSLVALFSAPTMAQFGFPKRKGSSFQELNEMAKEQQQKKTGPEVSMEKLQQLIQESMSDPEMQEALSGYTQGLSEAMEQLSKASPEEMMAQIQEGLNMLTSPDMMETILGQKEDVLASLIEQGLIDDEMAQTYKKNPQKFEDDMKKSFAQMKEIFNDPESLKAATQMMQGFAEMLTDPESVMKQVAETYAEDLNSDEKIEEARLQLLENPGKAGNPALAALFEENEEMKEMLKDPVKWREQVKKGQEMLLGDPKGAGIGEL